MNALPTLQSPLPRLAMAKACLSLLLLSSSAIVCCRRCAAALAPGPSCASLSSRQSPWLRTTATLKPLLISPMIFPSKPGPGSCPCALPIAATLDSAKSFKSWWRWGDRSPQGPATNWPSESPPKFLNLATKGPGTGSDKVLTKMVAGTS